MQTKNLMNMVSFSKKRMAACCGAVLSVMQAIATQVPTSGGMWDMGENSYGQLGAGQSHAFMTNRPQLVVTNNVTAVAALTDSMLLKTDGSLWICGGNGNSSLGDGPIQNTNVFTQIVPSNVIAMAAGGAHNLFIESDGSLWAFGYNLYGQLGDGTSTTALVPEKIEPSGVIAVAAGQNHSLFVNNDGSLWAMGEDQDSQLGDNYVGSTGNKPKMIEPSGVVAVAAGYYFSLFIKNDGSLWGMGDNGAGELGTGGDLDPATPYEIEPSGVVAVSGGYDFTLFVKNDGTVWGIGDNGVGELGTGTNTSTRVPVQIPLSNVAAVAAGYEISLFLKTDGSLWSTGDEAYGALGNGNYGTYPANYITTPVEIESQGVTAIAAGQLQSLFIQTVPPPPVPVIVNTSLSGPNVLIQATNGMANGTYLTLTSPTVAKTPNQWTPVETNILGPTLNASGSFSVTVTNGFSPANPQKFYMLELQ